jgi:hypothetical protein
MQCSISKHSKTFVFVMITKIKQVLASKKSALPTVKGKELIGNIDYSPNKILCILKSYRYSCSK